jgi:hypothetical protein
MRAAVRFAFVLLVPCVAAPVFAQESPPVNPDRPGISTGAETVARGALQLEAGIDHSGERRAGEPTQRRTSLATTVRYGLLDSVELRLDGEPVVGLRDGDDATNVGDVALGVKWRLLDGVDGARPTLSLFPSVKLPIAPDPIGTERPDFTLLGLASFNARPIGLDFNAGVSVVGQRDSDSYVVQGIVVGAITGDVTDRLKLFAELFYNSPSEREGEDLVGTSAGVIYELARNVAIDAAVITTLAGRGPDYRVQAGMTVRFWP